MSGLCRMFEPTTIAIAGLSPDPAKHGARVLAHLRRLGFPGDIWGVNPRLPEIEGVSVFSAMEALPAAPDLVVAAVPSAAAVDTVASSRGAGGVVVFAAGFADAGPKGADLQERLVAAARQAGTRVLGPNSGGIIRPGREVAASFLTCLDRPAEEIRSGPVGLVTQSGGTGSYIHNLAAARGDGLAVSIATGNEADLQLGEALAAVARMEEVRSVMAVVETLRDGEAFVGAVRESHRLGKRVVVCRIGSGTRGGELMASHTGAMALPPALLTGVFEALGVATAETPAEAYEVAGLLARLSPADGSRAGIVTHSGGIAILLADLAERQGIEIPEPSAGLREALGKWLDYGSADNPLDMGAIIDGPSRFAAAVEAFAGSDEYDAVVAVSSAHPPGHTNERVAGLLNLDGDRPVIHLWMAGDQATGGLATLRAQGAAVTEEPRAAIRALATLLHRIEPESTPLSPLVGPIESWGLPLVEGAMAADADGAVAAAERLGYPVVLKVEGSGLLHKTELGAVRLDLRRAEEVAQAYREVAHSLTAAGVDGWSVRVQPYRPGLEMIVGGLVDRSLGPIVSVGLGGTRTEISADVTFAPAPVDPRAALLMIGRLEGRRLLDGYRGSAPADRHRLAAIVSLVSRGVAGSGTAEVEINPLIWDGRDWWAVDWLVNRPSD